MIIKQYDNIILKLLIEAGREGLSINIISRNVYNESCSFFESIDYNDIHKYVQSYLYRKSHGIQPLIENTGDRGVYRINNSENVLQMHFEFDSKDKEEQEDTNVIDELEDQSLSFF